MTAEEIAMGLTDAQRWAMEHIGSAPLAYGCLHGSVRGRLFQKGLLECVDPRETPCCFRLTPLGQQVRSILEGNPHADQ